MSDPKHFIVVGAGGIGGPLANILVRQLNYEAPGSALIIVDGDNYEEKNKQRQDFSYWGNKAESVARRLAPEFLDTIIIGVPAWVIADPDEASAYDPSSETGSEDDEPVAKKVAAIDLLQEDSAVFAVVDNFKARKDIFEAASKFSNIDVFTGGNDDMYFGTFIHYQRRDGVDITPNPATYERFEEFNNPEDRNPGELSCQERAEIQGGTQVMATNMLVASVLGIRSHAVIFNNADPAPSLIYMQLDQGMAGGEDLRSAVENNKTPLGV